MTTCLNNKERTLKTSEQAAKIIVDVVLQEKKTNPFLKNTDIETFKVALNLRHQQHYPKNKDPITFRNEAEALLKGWKMDDRNPHDLVRYLDELFSTTSKTDNIMKKISDFQKILSVLIALSIIVSWIKGHSTPLSLQQNLSLFFETNNIYKHILNWKK